MHVQRGNKNISVAMPVIAGFEIDGSPLANG